MLKHLMLPETTTEGGQFPTVKGSQNIVSQKFPAD